MYVLPTLAYLADHGRRIAMRLRFGRAFDACNRAMCKLGILAVQRGWSFNTYNGTRLVVCLRPDGRTHGEGNPWLAMSPAISLAAAMSMVSR